MKLRNKENILGVIGQQKSPGQVSNKMMFLMEFCVLLK